MGLLPELPTPGPSWGGYTLALIVTAVLHANIFSGACLHTDIPPEYLSSSSAMFLLLLIVSHFLRVVYTGFSTLPSHLFPSHTAEAALIEVSMASVFPSPKVN